MQAKTPAPPPLVEPVKERKRTTEAMPLFEPAQATASMALSPQTPKFGLIGEELAEGGSLRNGRYLLRRLISRQVWQKRAYEAFWLAQDVQRGGVQVFISDVGLPAYDTAATTVLRNATNTFLSIGQHARIPALWDAFSERRRNLFVFEATEGMTLLSSIRQRKRAHSEAEVVDLCLQILDILAFLSQQPAPVVHGWIRPEHILLSGSDHKSSLIGFSVVMAGGGWQYLAGLERLRLSPYTVPELGNGLIDIRADLYSLLSTAYFAATGSVPARVATSAIVPKIRRLNPQLSEEFEEILAKGLHARASQRYQQVEELQQALQALLPSLTKPKEETVVVLREREKPSVEDTVARMLPEMFAIDFDGEEREKVALLPKPEELPPLRTGYEWLWASACFGMILLGLALLVGISRGML